MPLHFKLPFLPPSVNHAYFQKGNRRILTAKGKKFKVEVKTHIARNCPHVLDFFNREDPYTIIFSLYFEAVHTVGKTAKSRYKKIDVSNRVKLLEDALTDACGHDDSQHMIVAACKSTVPAGEEPHVEVWAFNQIEEECPIDEWVGRQPR